MDLLSTLLLAGFFFVMGAAVVGFVWYTQNSIRENEGKNKINPNTDPNLEVLARLMRDKTTQELVVGIDDKTYHNISELNPPKQRRLTFTSNVLSKWVILPPAEAGAEGQPATEQAATEQPANEQPPIDWPETEQTASEQPAVDQPATEQLVSEQPAIDWPETGQSASEQPVVDWPETEQTASERTASEQLASEQPPVDWSEIGLPATSQPVIDLADSDSPVAIPTEPPSPEVEWIPAESAPQEPTQGYVPPFMAGEAQVVKPVSTNLRDMVGGLLTPTPPVQNEYKSIATQINDLLQARLVGTTFISRGISVKDAPDQGVMVTLDGNSYPGVKDVPDDEVRNLIKSVVLEWEKQGKAEKNK